MLYTATITSASLRLRESRIVADLLLRGVSGQAWHEAVLDQNVLQMGSIESIKRISGLLSRMRSEYVIPLQGKMAARIEKLQGDIQVATSTAHRKRRQKELTKREKQQVELLTFDENIVTTLSAQLGWSQFCELLLVKDPLARDFYAKMCRVERWGVRTLGTKIGGTLLERTALVPRTLGEADMIIARSLLSPGN